MRRFSIVNRLQDKIIIFDVDQNEAGEEVRNRNGVNGDLHAEKTGSSEFQRPVVAGFS